MYLSKKSLTILLSGFCLFFVASGQSVTESIATATATSVSESNLSVTTNASENISSSINPSSTINSNNNSITSSTEPTFASTIASTPLPTVNTTGWDGDGNQPAPSKQSWLREHNRFVFIIFVGLFFIALLIWYIVRSVKGMRKRLEAENNAQLYMMQQATGNTAQQHQQQPIPEVSPPPPAYKQEEYRPNTS